MPKIPPISARMPGFGGYGESTAMINELLEELDITYWRLGRLIGTPNPSLVWKWARGLVRPSQRYCLNMIRLSNAIHRKENPLNIHAIEAINWETGEIKYFPTRQHDKSGHVVSATEREVPQQHRRKFAAPGQIPDQSSRQASPPARR